MQTKNTRWGWAAMLIAALLALGLALTGCDTGGGGTGGTGVIPGDDDPVTYSGGGFELKVAKNEAGLSKGAITPATDNWYWLKYKGQEISRGTITVNGEMWTFTVKSGSKVTSGYFTAAVSSGTLTFTTEIPYKDANGADQKIGVGTSASIPGSSPASLAGVWKYTVSQGSNFNTTTYVFFGNEFWYGGEGQVSGSSRVYWYYGTFTSTGTPTTGTLTLTNTHAWSDQRGSRWEEMSASSGNTETVSFSITGNTLAVTDANGTTQLTKYTGGTNIPGGITVGGGGGASGGPGTIFGIAYSKWEATNSGGKHYLIATSSIDTAYTTAQAALEAYFNANFSSHWQYDGNNAQGVSGFSVYTGSSMSNVNASWVIFEDEDGTGGIYRLVKCANGVQFGVGFHTY